MGCLFIWLGSCVLAVRNPLAEAMAPNVHNSLYSVDYPTADSHPTGICGPMARLDGFIVFFDLCIHIRVISTGPDSGIYGNLFDPERSRSICAQSRWFSIKDPSYIGDQMSRITV